jgi:hypothetical protein
MVGAGIQVGTHPLGDHLWAAPGDHRVHQPVAAPSACSSGPAQPGPRRAGWRNPHPQLDHYQTQSGPSACTPTGTTGAWHAASGSSGGWQRWQVDLSSLAGQQVEVSISYASDWSFQGLGVFVDDIEVSTGEGTTPFEAGLDGWSIPGAPPRSPRKIHC